MERLIFALLILFSPTANGFEISEKQLKNILDQMHELREAYDKVTEEVRDIKGELQTERRWNIEMGKELTELKKANTLLEREFVTFKSKEGKYNTSDLEDRVMILELEVSNIQTTLVEVVDEVDDLETGQSIQDDRMNNMEANINIVEGDVNSLESGYVDLLVRVDTNEEDIILHREQVNVLEKDIDHMVQQLTIMDGRITQLETSDGQIIDRLDNLETFANVTDSKDLDSRIEMLESIASNHEHEIDLLEINTSVLAERIADLQVKVAGNIDEIAEMSSEVDVLENIVGQDAVVFYAKLNDFTPYPDQTIVYGNVRLNLGNHYNSSSGIFTAPRSGIYYFSVNVRQTRQGIVADQFQIRLNGAGQCHAITDSETTAVISPTSSCNALLQLKTGDLVTVYAASNADSEFYDIDANYFNGFFIRGI